MRALKQTIPDVFTAMAAMRSPQRNAILLASRIQVDAKRLFYALSLPEYMEAWVQPPDLDEALVFESVTRERFQIDVYREGARRASVHGSTCVTSRTQIRYVWKAIHPQGVTHTTVDLWVLGGLDRCVVGLRHCGFREVTEQAWHRRMWDRSMRRLGSLIGNS